ncbi:hypothetical protein ACFL96_14835, partial [Thermoproteota archaeon]
FEARKNKDNPAPIEQKVDEESAKQELEAVVKAGLDPNKCVISPPTMGGGAYCDSATEPNTGKNIKDDLKIENQRPFPSQHAVRSAGMDPMECRVDPKGRSCKDKKTGAYRSIDGLRPVFDGQVLLSDEMEEGMTKTYHAGNKDYEITLLAVTDGRKEPKASFKVNGQTTGGILTDDVFGLGDNLFLRVEEIFNNEPGEKVSDYTLFSLVTDKDEDERDVFRGSGPRQVKRDMGGSYLRMTDVNDLGMNEWSFAWETTTNSAGVKVKREVALHESVRDIYGQGEITPEVAKAIKDGKIIYDTDKLEDMKEVMNMKLGPTEPHRTKEEWNERRKKKAKNRQKWNKIKCKDTPIGRRCIHPVTELWTRPESIKEDKTASNKHDTDCRVYIQFGKDPEKKMKCVDLETGKWIDDYEKYLKEHPEERPRQKSADDQPSKYKPWWHNLAKKLDCEEGGLGGEYTRCKHPLTGKKATIKQIGADKRASQKYGRDCVERNPRHYIPSHEKDISCKDPKTGRWIEDYPQHLRNKAKAKAKRKRRKKVNWKKVKCEEKHTQLGPATLCEHPLTGHLVTLSELDLDKKLSEKYKRNCMWEGWGYTRKVRCVNPKTGAWIDNYDKNHGDKKSGNSTPGAVNPLTPSPQGGYGNGFGRSSDIYKPRTPAPSLGIMNNYLNNSEQKIKERQRKQDRGTNKKKK